LLLLSACAPQTLAGVRAPPGFAPPNWALVEPLAVETSLVEYWTLLGDPLLSEYVDRAIANNRDLAAATARVAQARAGVRAARASYFPRIDASATVQKELGSFAEDELQFSLGADARWEADLFGRIGYDVAANREQVRAAGFALADLQRLIIGQVAQTTISARALAVQLAIARNALITQDENLQIARWRLQAGLVSSLDVEQARTQRAQTAATIPALERDLAASANTISTLIGEPPGPVLAALSDTAAIPAPPPGPGYPAPAEVLRSRPDVRQAEANLLADGARVGLAKSQLLPLVQLTGNVGTTSVGVDELFEIITGGLFASVGQLIFDGGRTRAQIAGAEAQAEASLAGWEQSILLALQDVETASVALRSERSRVEIFAEAFDAANNGAVLARTQYQTGLIDFQTLLVAENQLLSARTSLAASEAERANAFVRLTQALGGGWQGSVSPEMSDEASKGIEQ
tara:strand:+ start:809 stop:2194 length:1386 start_codon:yes stop_codon:yes gene_type:complete